LRRNDELLDVNPNRPVRASLLVMSVAAVLTRFASDRRKGIRPVGLNAGITEAFPFTRLVWQKSQLRHMTPGIDPTCSYRRNSPPPPSLCLENRALAPSSARCSAPKILRTSVSVNS